ncbi:N-acetyltransferase family protein [Evansella sp. AB-rgal1]|uniref:GNAT family N-acetyltransferase n=1 Tax=Evansella sp. AB-rgal1 TaxID=3242696 RepID=UPI00359E294B
MAFVSPKRVLTKQKNTIIIRTGDMNDALGMHELTKDVLREEKGLVMTIHDFTMTVEDQRIKNDWYVQLPKTLTLLAEDQKKIIGILTIEPEPFIKTAHRGNLGIIIHKDYRSEGVGNALMETALQWVKSSKMYDKIQLEVLESNIRGIALYEKLGFKIEGIIKNALKHANNSYENIHIMGLQIQ